MQKGGVIGEKIPTFLFKVVHFLRKCIFSVLSVGPIPEHIAFIMDGNRRYARLRNLKEGAGHDAGYFALMSMVIYCCELGIKYVTAYAFSIDNFKRGPEEVQYIMDLMMEKIEQMCQKDSIVNRYGVRIHFSGNLQLLSEPIRNATKKLMVVTANNSNVFLTLCVAYTSTDEIIHAIQKSCEEKWAENRESRFLYCGVINLVDIEKKMYMAIAPDPDIVVRTSGVNRLSNFLLWQSAGSYLFSTSALWQDFSFWHLVWVVMNFQRNQPRLEKKKKQL
ncbi:hypothetical protein DITRI_Ditri01bG0094700 [Diplodiscus trichospermus]